MSQPNREAEIGDAVSQGMVWDGVEWMQGNYKTAVNNLAKKLGIADTLSELNQSELSDCCGYPITNGLCNRCHEHA
jgi:hypothetical protein